MTLLYACISTHHLLDHKPDNLLRTGHKHKLNGFYKFGTPGIGVAWGDQHSLDSFMDTLKSAMPQKKFEFLFIRSTDSSVQEVEGWNEVNPQQLKDALASVGAPEDDYYAILGIQKRQEAKGKGGKAEKGSKSKGKGGKKK